MRAAGRLFAQMSQHVVRAPCVWWDTTPTGRVLNRFCFDTENVDTVLLSKLFPALMSLSWMAGALCVLLGVLWPWALLGIPGPALAYVNLFQCLPHPKRNLLCPGHMFCVRDTFPVSRKQRIFGRKK